MNLLLDTHAVIWFITADNQLPPSVTSNIENNQNHCFVSIATLWEIAIKFSLGKLDLKADLKKIFGIIESSGLIMLPITSTHILVNANLEFHHRDPFDRLLIAQAKSEGFTLISKDRAFQDYNVDVMWENSSTI